MGLNNLLVQKVYCTYGTLNGDGQGNVNAYNASQLNFEMDADYELVGLVGGIVLNTNPKITPNSFLIEFLFKYKGEEINPFSYNGTSNNYFRITDSVPGLGLDASGIVFDEVCFRSTSYARFNGFPLSTTSSTDTATAFIQMSAIRR